MVLLDLEDWNVHHLRSPSQHPLALQTIARTRYRLARPARSYWSLSKQCWNHPHGIQWVQALSNRRSWCRNCSSRRRNQLPVASDHLGTKYPCDRHVEIASIHSNRLSGSIGEPNSQCPVCLGRKRLRSYPHNNNWGWPTCFRPSCWVSTTVFC